jgi:hypothetical protein
VDSVKLLAAWIPNATIRKNAWMESVLDNRRRRKKRKKKEIIGKFFYWMK